MITAAIILGLLLIGFFVFITWPTPRCPRCNCCVTIKLNRHAHKRYECTQCYYTFNMEGPQS